MDDFSAGTGMVDLDVVKLKLSYRDFLLLVGIIVAMIVAITTIGYRETKPRQSSNEPRSSVEIKPAVHAALRSLIK